MTLLAVTLAGALGAACRCTVDYVLSQLRPRGLPIGTLAVNVVGSAAAGVLAGWVARHGVDEAIRAVVGTGFLAAFTTFSTFAVETLHLAHERARRAAVVNVAAHLLLSIGAAALGYGLLTAG